MPRRRSDSTEEYLRERNFPCVSCGYNLRGNTNSHCPECGWGFNIDALRSLAVERESRLMPIAWFLERAGDVRFCWVPAAAIFALVLLYPAEARPSVDLFILWLFRVAALSSGVLLTAIAPVAFKDAHFEDRWYARIAIPVWLLATLTTIIATLVIIAAALA